MTKPAVPKPMPRIALIDDDAAVREAVGFALNAEGYEVEGFANAQAVLALGDPDSFACLVVDLRLPDDDGLSLIRALRQRGCTVPAILMTTQPDARCRREAARISTPIVEKPLIGDVLSDCIRAVSG